MPLLDSYTTVNPQPGTVSDQGTWTLSTTNDSNGNKYLINGAKKAFYFPGPGIWFIGPTLGTTNGNDYSQSTSGQSATTFPLTGWGVATGAAPAPTFTGGSGGSAGPPLNLTTVVVY